MLQQLLIQFVKESRNSGLSITECERELRKQFIIESLKANGFNQCRAAKEMGMHRNTLSRAIDELEISVSLIRQGNRKAAGSVVKVSKQEFDEVG